MKAKTIVKVLKRYSKSLDFMAAECNSEDEKSDREHYLFDKNVFDEAIRLIERRKE